MIDGRHPHRAAPRHLGKRLVVHVGAVLDRIRAGANRIAHAAGAVRMNRHFLAGGVGGVDDGFHFVEGDGLRAVDAFVAAARAEDLDPVRRRP